MGREIPYSPMRDSKKLVTHQDMLRTLAKHAPKTETVGSTEPRKNESPPNVYHTSSSSPESLGTEREARKRMKWRTVDENIAESNFGYRVLRCTADGKPTGRFIAFKGKTTDLRSPLVLGGYDSWEDARTACDAHFAQVEAA